MFLIPVILLPQSRAYSSPRVEYISARFWFRLTSTKYKSRGFRSATAQLTMGNTESITIGETSDKAGNRSRKILRKFEKMHSQKSHAVEDPNSKNVEIVESASAESKKECELVEDQSPSDCPVLSTEDRQIIIRTWAIVEEHISQVGLSSFLELFRRAPDSLQAFPFLKKLNHEDLEFYAQVIISKQRILLNYN